MSKAEWTVRNYPNGVAIFSEGGLPFDDLIPLAKMYEKKGFDQMHPGIADAIGATFVFTTKAKGEAWMAELAKSGDWLTSGDTGTSSKTIYSVMKGGRGVGSDVGVPHDPSDFGRCYRLLQRFPGWLARLPEVAERYPEWGPMVREWDQMTAIYERDVASGRSDELYELMAKLEAEGRSAPVPA